MAEKPESRAPDRVAVLGGTGFAGQSVVAELQRAGIRVEAFSRRTGCDLLDEARAVACLSRFEPTHIVNCAGAGGNVSYLEQFSADVLDLNARIVLSTYRIAEQLSPVRVINLVASCVYPGAIDVHEESRLWDGVPHSSVRSFGEAHRLLLALAECYRRQKGVASVSLVAPNLYGPNHGTDPQKTKALNALVLKFVRAERAGTPHVEVWGTGRAVREWLFVYDMARVVRSAIESPASLPAVLNISQKRGISVAELVETIRSAVAYTGSVVYNTAHGDGAPARIMDDALFSRHFPQFAFTALAEGIRATIDDYQDVLDREHAAPRATC